MVKYYYVKTISDLSNVKITKKDNLSCFSSLPDSSLWMSGTISASVLVTIERLRNENEDKTKMQITQSFNQYTENETKIWRQNILNQFNRVSSSCLRSHFVISLMAGAKQTDAKCKSSSSFHTNG